MRGLYAISNTLDVKRLFMLFCMAALLLTLSALFSVCESAILAMNKLRLRIKCRANDKRALRLSRLLMQKEKLINSLLCANCLVNISLSSLAAKAALEVFGNAGAGGAAFITTIALLIFGEITPKTLASYHASTIAYSLSAFIYVTVLIFRPLSNAFTFIANTVLRLTKLNTLDIKHSYTQDDIKSVIYEGVNSGAISVDESEMARGVFRFTDLEARDIMVPRKDIMALQEEATYNDIKNLFQKTGHTRYPVYRNGIDDVVGTLYIKDLLKINSGKDKRAAGKRDIRVKDIMRPPLFILGSKKMSSIQAACMENHQSMAIVVDEYSGTDGILTTDDITQRIFGIKEKDSLPPAAKTFIVSGSTLLIELQERLNIPIRSNLNETLSGWLTERLGDIPKAGDSVDFYGFHFSIIRLASYCVEEVAITDTNYSRLNE